MQNTITVRQQLTYKEFLNAMLYAFFISRRVRRYFGFMLIISCASNLLGFLTTSKFSFTLQDAAFIVFFIGSLALAGMLALLIITWWVYQKRPDLFNNVLYQFSHWGITREGPNTNFSKPWREIDRFRESKQFFLIYVSRFDVHIIQKKMIGDVERINIFRSMLEANVGGK
ncbi:YcxB family protein [Niastella vici]|nr:YcxB family protein [Niastella vici]